MLIRRTPGWALPERAATPEPVVLNRRALLAGGAGLIGSAVLPAAAENGPGEGLYPARRNGAFEAGRAITPEADTSDYNNFYEFGASKRVAAAAQKLKTSPWTLTIDGMVEAPMQIGIDDLIRRMPLEERVYRHRCVEAWAMTVPWTGFAMAELVKLARPLGSAKYVVMQTFHDPAVAPGQRQTWYPWPYTEGMTIAEAGNELAFLVTGIYGKPLPKQFGAPLRLALPWKYGFKSIKSITRISFTDTRPKSFWETLQDEEYGFWANVNPEVSHPRWSQATERLLGTDERVPTRIFNGYGEYVASLYKGLEGERLFV